MHGEHSLLSLFVEGGHDREHLVILRLGEKPSLSGGRENAGTKGLGEDKDIALFGPVIGENLVRMGKSHHAQPVFGLLVLNAVAADDDGTRLHHLVISAGQDALHHLQRQAVGEGEQIHGDFRRAAHGPHIGQGIGGGHLTELEGIVHNGREEIHRGDHGRLIVDAVDRRVVAGVKPHHQIRIIDAGQIGEQFSKDTRSYFGPSPTG